MKYKKTPGSGGGLEGMLYQTKLIALCMLQLKNVTGDFRFATEFSGATPLDDLVIDYSGKSIYGQAKYKAGLKISISRNMLNERNKLKKCEFSLEKYFNCYQSLAAEAESKASEFILCTNAVLEDNVKEDVEDVEDQTSNLLYIEGAKVQKFRVDSKSVKQLKKHYPLEASKIEAFFGSFILITEHPSEDKLDDVLNKMLSEENCIQTSEKGVSKQFESRLYLFELKQAIMGWILEKEGVYYCKDSLQKVFDAIRFKISAIKMQEHTDEFCKQFADVTFEERECQRRIRGFLDSGKDEILIIKNVKSHYISCAKTCEVIRGLGTGYIFNKYEKLLQLEESKKLVTYAVKHENIRVVVVSHYNCADDKGLFKKLAGAMGNGKKLIIITSDACFNDVVGTSEINDTDCDLSAFSCRSQKHILSRKIMMHNKSVAIDRILPSEHGVILEERILCRILRRKKISIGDISAVDDDSSKYYIEATLHQPLRRNYDSTDVISSNEKFVLISSEAGYGKSSFLKHLARQYRKTLQTSAKWVAWVSLVDYCEYFKKQSGTVMHKKDVLLFLLYVILREDKEDLIDKLGNAMYFTSNDEIRLSDIDLSDLLHFEVQCFISMYNSGRMVLLLDGYDEIAPQYKDTVKSYIGTIASTKIAKTIITSRPYIICNELMVYLNVTPYQLQEFKSEDQKKFLMRFWKYKTNSKRDEELSAFIDALMYAIDLSENTSELFKVPMHTKLIGEMFENYMTRKLSVEQIRNIVDKKLNLPELYEHFLRQKIIDAVCVKHGINSNKSEILIRFGKTYEDYIKKYKKLAMQVIFRDCGHLLSKKDLGLIEDSINLGEDKNGLLYSIDKFAHKSIAEYLSATWLHENAADAHAESCIAKVYATGYQYRGVRTFLDHLIIRSDASDKSRSITHCFKDNLDEFRNSFVFDVAGYADKYGRNVFYYIMEYGSDRLLQYVVDVINNQNDLRTFLHHRDKFGFSALSWAVAQEYYGKLERFVKGTMDFDIQGLDVVAVMTMDSVDLFHYMRGKGLDMRHVQDNGDNYLHLAVSLKSKRIAEYISRVANVLLRLANNEGQTPLMYAARSGSHDFTQLLIGSDVNARCAVGKTPLMYAITEGNKKSVELLLIETGADLNIRSHEGKTALMYAIIKGNEESVQVLLENSAEVNARCKEGKTPLIYAVLKANCKVINNLISRANLNTGGKEGKTPLIYVIGKGNDALVNALIGAGADINLSCKMGKTPLIHAITKGTDQSVELLIEKGSDINKCCKEDKTPLMHAIISRDDASAELLIKNKARVDPTCIKGKTSLMYAITNKNDKLVTRLLENNADTNIRCKKGKNALIYAITKGNDASTNQLIDNDLNIACAEGKTPLMHAIIRGNGKLVETLIGKNINNINAICNSGKTALIYAISKNNIVLVKSLIDKGADVNIARKTPLMYAAETGLSKYVELLLPIANVCTNINARCLQGKTALMFAVISGNHRSVTLLIEAGADVNATCEERKTPLMYAAEKGHFHTFDILYNRTNNITSKCSKGRNLLHLACFGGSVNLAMQIINQGIFDVNERCDNNVNILHLAAASNSVDLLRYLCNLRTLECNLADVDAYGKTSLHWAIEHDAFEATEYIIEQRYDLMSVCDGNGCFPVHYACALYHTNILQLLRNRGANVHQLDLDGNSTLHYVAKNVTWLNIYNLININVNISACNKRNETVAHWLAMYCKDKLLFRKIMTDFLLNADILNKADENGNSPLHWAVMNNNSEIADELIKLGCVTDLVNKELMTASDIAIVRDNSEMVAVFQKWEVVE